MNKTIANIRAHPRSSEAKKKPGAPKLRYGQSDGRRRSGKYYPAAVLQEAFMLYCFMKNGSQVAKRLREKGLLCTVETVNRWIKQYNWQQRKTTIQQQATKNLDESLTETIARHIKTLQFIQGKGIKNIQEGSQKVIPKDVIESIKQEILLKGGNTEKIEHTGMPVIHVHWGKKPK